MNKCFGLITVRKLSLCKNGLFTNSKITFTCRALILGGHSIVCNLQIFVLHKGCERRGFRGEVISFIGPIPQRAQGELVNFELSLSSVGLQPCHVPGSHILFLNGWGCGLPLLMMKFITTVKLALV